MSKPWVIWSYEHDAWWAPSECGYTRELIVAGVYTEARAKEIEAKANEHCQAVQEKAMPLDEALGMVCEGRRGRTVLYAMECQWARDALEEARDAAAEATWKVREEYEGY